MFELLFKYPRAAFEHGELVLSSGAPGWLLPALVALAAVLLAWLLRRARARGRSALGGGPLALLWGLQLASVAGVLLLLWQPALLVTQLSPRQNIVAVLVDDSRSMGQSDAGGTRAARAQQLLAAGTLAKLRGSFQTRLYRFDSGITQVADVSQLGTANAPATHIGASLTQLVTQLEGLPLAAVVLLSDGGDNAGGLDPAALAALRNRRIPVYTVGLGAEEVSRDSELEDVVVPGRALAGSRLAATVKLQQRGYAGRHATLSVRAGGQLLGSREVTFGKDGVVQAVSVVFNIGAAGVKPLEFSLQPQADEDNAANNVLLRLVNVEQQPRRILYFEGEPRWEYKFIRRAAEDDPMVQLVSMLRTTENKIYRQGISDPGELAAGFPARAQDLFGYDALIMGSVDAGYFSPVQQHLIRDFVDRRGGGLLLLGGRQSLADGVWEGSALKDVLPVVLPAARPSFHRDHATVSLTPAGIDSAITRLVDDPVANAAAWRRLPYLMDYQDPGRPKPGALELARMLPAGGRELPLLVTQSYGSGRSAVLATGGTWRWQMSMPLGDKSHDLFWQQLLRWLVNDTRGRVQATPAAATVLDDSHLTLTADVRDEEYHAGADARVTARVLGPAGAATQVALAAVPGSPGRFQAELGAPGPGVYVADVSAVRGAQEIGRDALVFQRLDGVAESFHTAQNRALLTRLAAATGGRYLPAAQLAQVADEIPYSPAGVSLHQIKELWNMPAAFLALLLLKSAEWLLRRRSGVV
jgi:uncharacterized membrane protein